MLYSFCVWRILAHNAILFAGNKAWRGTDYVADVRIGGRGVFRQGAVRVCKYACVYEHTQLRRGQRKYIAGGTAAGLSQQRNHGRARVQEHRLEGMPAAGGAGAGGQYSGHNAAENRGRAPD